MGKIKKNNHNNIQIRLRIFLKIYKLFVKNNNIIIYI